MPSVKLISRIALIFGLLALIAAMAQSKLVEGVEIRGYRTVTREDIMKRIETAPGKPFSLRRAQRDFERLMKMGVFDELKSKLVIEDGPRGGKVVIFDLEENQRQK
jgi:outer membrane protein assembly factor BamA